MRRAGAAVLALVASACSDKPAPPAQPPDAALPSPNASILPAPLASQPGEPGQVGVLFDDKGRPVTTAQPPGPPPEVARADQAFPADGATPKEAFGLALTGEWRWLDVPAPPKAAEVHADGIAAARKLTAFRWAVSVGEVGRLRIGFDARSFPVPLGSELRARVDRLGHALVFPNGTEYRVVPQGGLRSLFGDRRLDVLPLMPGKVTPKGAGVSKSGRTSRRVEVATKLGTVALDLAHVPEAGQGGLLLCRTLVELVGAEGPAPLCAPEELPLRAQFSWPGGGGIVFEIADVPKRTELPITDVLAPPPAARFTTGLMPSPSGFFLTKDELAAFRTKAVELPAAQKGAPGEGLVAKNSTEALQYLTVDGVPVAYVLPGLEQYVIGPPRGRYVVQWRTFLGDAVAPARTVEVPARVAVGEREEPAPPAPAKSK